MIPKLDKARFWIKAYQTDYCWEWKGALNNNGYGFFRLEKPILAHRLAYQLIEEIRAI